MTKKDTITYTVKVDTCPYCKYKLDFSGYSKSDVKTAISNLYNDIDNHLKVCKKKKYSTEKELVKISINTKKFTDKLYSSIFDTNLLLIG